METVISYGALQQLCEAARGVLNGNSSPELLRQPLMELDEMVKFRESARGQEVIEEARGLHIDYACDIDIDDATVVYHNDTNGYWVLGWCFVHDRESDEENEDEEDEGDEQLPVIATDKPQP